MCRRNKHDPGDDRTNLAGREITVPADVLALVEQASAYLLQQIREAEYLPVAVTWHRFDNSGGTWAVEVLIEYGGLSKRQQIDLGQLWDARQIREVAGRLSTWHKSDLRRIRAELVQLAAELRE